MEQRARLEPTDDGSQRARSDLRKRRSCAFDAAIQRYGPAAPHDLVDQWDLQDLVGDHEIGHWD